MGNDGGSIPKRRELVQEAARNLTTTELKEKLAEHQQHYWRHDPLSDQPLRAPVVSDGLGRLYNKASIVSYLLPLEDKVSASRRAEQEAFVNGAVTRLKDVVEVKFALETPEEADEGNGSDIKWVCPVTDKPLGLKTRAVYLVPCGHAFAASAIDQLEDHRCSQCDAEYKPRDVISILPVAEEDVSRLRKRMYTLREQGLSHSLKKDKSAGGEGKKRKKIAADDVTPASKNAATAAITALSDTAKTTKPAEATSNMDKPNVAGIKNAATASLTARVMAEQEERAKRRKLANGGNDNLQSLFKAKHDANKAAQNNDFMTRGFAIGR